MTRTRYFLAGLLLALGVGAAAQTLMPVPEGLGETGDILYFRDANNLDNLDAVATGSVLSSAGASTAPAWSSTPTLTDLTITGNIVRTGQERVACGGYSKVGATAGWSVGGGAVDTGLRGTVAAQGAFPQAATLVVPCFGLKVGDTITGFEVVGQVESAGNTVLVDADLRVHEAAAADVSDISLATITQVSAVADQVLAETATVSTVVTDSMSFYVLLTGTAMTSTDIALQGVNITVTEN